MAPSTGRPLGFDRDVVLDAVVDTFWVHGYAGTTTSVLEAQTGLSRSSLLNTFGPKDELCLAAVDRYQQRVDQWLVGPLLDGTEGVTEIEAFFVLLAQLKESAPGSSGCLVVNLSAEMADIAPGLRWRVERYSRSLQEGFEAALVRAEARGEVRPGDVPARAAALVALAVTVNWTARSGTPEQARLVAASASSLLSELSP